MSKSKKTELYTARYETEGHMTHSTGLVMSEIPGSESSGTEMPAGTMNGGSGNNGLATSEMPSGSMSGVVGASPGSMGFPASSMTGSAGLAESDMPSGFMAGAQSSTDAGLTVTEMPSGYIQTESGRVAEKATDSFPVLEITGEWLLTLSPTSLKRSPGN